jgi:hypothetical protein
VIALAMPSELTSVGGEELLQLAGEVGQELCSALVGNDLDLAHKPEGNVSSARDAVLGEKLGDQDFELTDPRTPLP